MIRFVNATASALLPNLPVGELLGGALDPRTVDTRATSGAHAPREVELAAGERRLQARRRILSDGWVAWYVDDVTEQHLRLDNLLVERSRSRFLASASPRLGLSLHPGRTAKTVVELAVAEADSALDDDLGQVVEFLAAAIYFGDRGLFADHVGWLADVAASRGATRDRAAGRLRRLPRRAARLPGRCGLPRCRPRGTGGPGMTGPDHSRPDGPR